MIEINNQTKARISHKFIKDILNNSAKQLKLKKINLSVALVGENKIKKLNQAYRNKNIVTDVLSFNLNPQNKPAIDGEIIICYPQAKKQARQKKHPIRTELAILLVHGLLHLAGYDHQTNKDLRQMTKLTEELLKQPICS